jgi:DNA-binding SARP family transcriptional activator
MTTAKLIDAVERGGHAVTQPELDLFVQAADDLAAAVLDAGEVCRAIHALDSGHDDHDEVRWTVLHGIEHQRFEDYVRGLAQALVESSGSRWAQLMTARLARSESLWPRVAALLAQDPATRAAWIAALRALATATGEDRFGKLADAL